MMKTRPLRSRDVRERNEKLVLKLIYNRRGISQSEISSITGLKPPTIFRIFTSLIEQGFITECDTDRVVAEKKGRKPSFFCVNPRVRYSIGVDFWWQSAAVLVADFSGQPIHEELVKFEVGIDAERMMIQIENLIRNAIRKSGIQEQKIIGIGIGAPGVVDIQEGRVLKYPRAKGMTNYSIKDRISASFPIPVYIHNNCSVIALSEYRYGRARGQESMLAILIRAGVGGAFIQDGRAFVNQNKTALEVGHLSVDVDGRRCQCGARGCLESYLSEEAILQEVEAAGERATWENLEELLKRKDPKTTEVMNRLGAILWTAVCSLINLLNPEAVLIVSRHRFLSDFFVSVIRESLQKLALENQLGPVNVISEEYRPTIACKGAADLVFDHFFDVTK
jgi:predicted NBD/HSP70 family sugar kinase